MKVEKPKGIGWFKTIKLFRHAGKLKIETYFQVMSDGKIQKLDVKRLKIANQFSFGALPMNITTSTKEEWDKVRNKILNKINKDFI